MREWKREVPALNGRNLTHIMGQFQIAPSMERRMGYSDDV